jgi:antirestriction protein ArdC
MSNDRQDVYARVTAAIVADLERGVRPWVKPWTAGNGDVSRPVRHTGVSYRGINVVLLWLAALQGCFACPMWMTYKQAAELGGQVRRGEKGATVVYADRFIRVESGDNGEEHEHAIPFLKSYSVFNCEQIDGLPAHYYATPERDSRVIGRIGRAERFFGNTGADIRHGGGSAYYAPSGDFVQMPPFESFTTAEAYYATLAHELTHWSGHASRLAREFGRQRWGDEARAMEELVAESGAAFLCADLGLTPETREDHAAYIGSWLKVLKNDKRAIFTAAGHAQRAADFLHSLQPKEAEIGS